MSNHIEEATRAWTICPTCEGNGSTGPGWVMTQDDVDEMGHEFDEYMENMREGMYNVPCTECKGVRVVKETCECLACLEEANEAYEDAYLDRMERMYC